MKKIEICENFKLGQELLLQKKKKNDPISYKCIILKIIKCFIELKSAVLFVANLVFWKKIKSKGPITPRAFAGCTNHVGYQKVIKIVPNFLPSPIIRHSLSLDVLAQF